MIYIFSNNMLKISNIELIDRGNPGLGGSEYLLLQLFYYMNKFYPNIGCKFLTVDKNLLGKNIIHVDNYDQALDIVSKNDHSKLVFIPKSFDNRFYDKLEKYNIDGIAWVHNYIPYNLIDILNKYNSIRRVVFVSKEHYESYIDSKIAKKSCYIDNMISYGFHEYIDPTKKENIVTYVGAIIPIKGFHVLAKVWKKVLKKVPDARLYVIGGANLYRSANKLGKYGIASAEYEKKFIKYVSDKNGLLPSVKFFGVLGKEKEDVIINSKVGIANPIGLSETFCLSAVEYKAYGIPVVSYKGYGLLSTIRHNEDGILIKNYRQLYKAIVKLLLNNELNRTLGKNGYDNGYKMYFPEKIIPLWVELLNNTNLNDSIEIKIPTNNHFNDYKILKIINLKLQNFFHCENNGISYNISKFKSTIKRMVKK